MDEKIKCECGESAFWWFGDYVRCPNCYNELKHDPSGQTWMRKFNFNENKYIENWEHWGNAVSEKERKLEQQLKEANDELEVERMRLAGCSVAALGYFDGCDDEYKSASLDDVLSLYEQLKERDALLDECEPVVVDSIATCDLLIELIDKGYFTNKDKADEYKKVIEKNRPITEALLTKIKNRDKP